MPYKLNKTTILVQKGSKWTPLKVHKTRDDALAHLRALMANVPEAKSKKGKK